MAGKAITAWVGVIALVMGVHAAAVPSLAAASKKSSAKKTETKSDPAAESTAAVDRAAKLLATGKAAEAERYLSSALSTGKLPRKTMARALYLRGLAYRKLNKSALAISDLTSALWVQNGLTDAERRDATDARAAAYREAGIENPAGPSTTASNASAPSSAAGVRAAAPTASAPPQGWQPVTRATTATRAPAARAPEPAPTSTTSSGGFGSFFSGLFGGGSGAPETTSSTTRSAPPPTAGVTRPASPSVSAWSSEVKPRNTSQSGPAPAAPKSAVSRPSQQTMAAAKPGGYVLQITAVRSKAQAEAIVARVQKAHGRHLAGRQVTVDTTVVGNMGAFYRVKAGPFQTAAEHRALCDALRKEGLDCLEIRQR